MIICQQLGVWVNTTSILLAGRKYWQESGGVHAAKCQRRLQMSVSFSFIQQAKK